MKKLVKYAGLCIMCIIVISGCSGKSRTAITADEFIKTMSDTGYTIEDVTGQFEEGAVEAVVLAVMNEEYQIEFFEMPDEAQARAAYDVNQTTLEQYKSNVSKYSSVSLGNYSYYKLTTGEYYCVVSRIDNTFIYIRADKGYKSDIDNALKTLGY